MYSDASKNASLGFGALCGRSWMFGTLPDNYIKKFNPSIEYLELFGVVCGVVQWIHRFKNSRVVLFCDNTSVVNMINGMTTSCRNCMVLLRILILKGMTENM